MIMSWMTKQPLAPCNRKRTRREWTLCSEISAWPSQLLWPCVMISTALMNGGPVGESSAHIKVLYIKMYIQYQFKLCPWLATGPKIASQGIWQHFNSAHYHRPTSYFLDTTKCAPLVKSLRWQKNIWLKETLIICFYIATGWAFLQLSCTTLACNLPRFCYISQSRKSLLSAAENIFGHINVCAGRICSSVIGRKASQQMLPVTHPADAASDTPCPPTLLNAWQRSRGHFLT